LIESLHVFKGYGAKKLIEEVLMDGDCEDWTNF